MNAPRPARRSLVLALALSGCATESQAWLAASEWIVATPDPVELHSADGAAVDAGVLLTNTGPETIDAAVELWPEVFGADAEVVEIDSGGATLLTLRFEPDGSAAVEGTLRLVLDGSTWKDIPLLGLRD
jgi:hypothetical protein